MRGMVFKHARAARLALVLVGALALLVWAQAAFAREGLRNSLTSTPSPPAAASGYSATVEQCVTSSVQSERSATFTAQMVATGTTQRMEIKIQLQQRMRGEPEYHTVAAPNLGIWRGSEPGVKIDKYVQQVTGLTAPAAYRALVQFRWLGDKGHMLRHAELHTFHCLQPALSGQVTQTPPSGTS
jgi:hypothetical protein